MKKIVILLLVLIASCTSKKDSSGSVPLVNKDTVVLSPQQKNWKASANDPSRGKIEVILSNYTDSSKIFIINIEEIK